MDKQAKAAAIKVAMSALRWVSSRCDGAVSLDGQGFSGTDSALGNALAQPLTLPGADMRRIADAWAQAFGIGPSARAAAISLNRPYPGGYEVIHYGALLARCGRPRVGAYQVESMSNQ